MRGLRGMRHLRGLKRVGFVHSAAGGGAPYDEFVTSIIDAVGGINNMNFAFYGEDPRLVDPATVPADGIYGMFDIFDGSYLPATANLSYAGQKFLDSGVEQPIGGNGKAAFRFDPTTTPYDTTKPGSVGVAASPGFTGFPAGNFDMWFVAELNDLMLLNDGDVFVVMSTGRVSGEDGTQGYELRVRTTNQIDPTAVAVDFILESGDNLVTTKQVTVSTVMDFDTIYNTGVILCVSQSNATGLITLRLYDASGVQYASQASAVFTSWTAGSDRVAFGQTVWSAAGLVDAKMTFGGCFAYANATDSAALRNSIAVLLANYYLPPANPL